jgi:hypothetical protein
MRSYRCYFLDGARKISDVEAVDCADDDTVTRVALELLATKNLARSTFGAFAAVEIWEADRLIGLHAHDARA